ncbi:MAG: nicotinate-nucleotide adenylyltransferase [Pseudomonadota bacterium]
MPLKALTAHPNQRIGLLGGSFDPPHAGHLHITAWALKRLALDQVWWLVSPGNPLKDRGPAGIEARLAACRTIVTHPRVRVSDVESQLKTRFTADTLAALADRLGGVRFVWLMGADNLASFHRWDRWSWIAENVPIGVLARPGEQLRAGLSPMARRYARFRLPEPRAAELGHGIAPQWVLLTGPMSAQSSTALRTEGTWP